METIVTAGEREFAKEDLRATYSYDFARKWTAGVNYTLLYIYHAMPLPLNSYQNNFQINLGYHF